MATKAKKRSAKIIRSKVWVVQYWNSSDKQYGIAGIPLETGTGSFPRCGVMTSKKNARTFRRYWSELCGGRYSGRIIEATLTWSEPRRSKR